MLVKEILKKYINLISSISDESSLENLDLLFSRLEDHFESKGRIFLAGNGGSSAISSHAAADLSKLEKNRRLLNVISLNTNIANLTANSNDYGYENVFVNSVKNFDPNGNDTLITISSSGNSQNIINVLNYCNDKNVFTFSLNGFNGGEAINISKLGVTFHSNTNYYGPIEDLHMMVFHIFAHIIRKDIEELH